MSSSPKPPLVTLLGKSEHVGNVPAETFVGHRTQAWGRQPRWLTDLDTFEAIKYLQGPGRLAVVASAIENSPYTVLECLANGIPLLASDVGGSAELIAADDRPHVLFKREPHALRAKLQVTLRDGALRARPAIDLEANRERWRDWSAKLVPDPVRPGAKAAIVQDDRPLVSACMSTFNRPHLLAYAIDSIERRTYAPLEVVLVDDASPSDENRRYLDASSSPVSKKRGWTIIRNSEPLLWTGGARNLAVARSRGAYVLLMDDDNIARPDAVETFVRAAPAFRTPTY